MLPALVQRGHQVAAATVHGGLALPDEDGLQGVAVHRFHLEASSPAQQLPRLAAARVRFLELVRTFRPDVIHVNSMSPTAFPLLASERRPPAPLLVSLHSEITPALTGRIDTLTGRILDRAAWVTACSDAILREARRAVPGITARSSVLPGFLAMPSTSPTPLHFDPPSLFCAARLIRRKGLDLMLQAMACLRSRFPGLRAVIAGDGEERAALEADAAALDIRDRVAFAGWVAPARVWELLNAATLAVVPSRAEPFGMVALEASVMSRPVVAARVGGLPEAVLDGRTGLLVKPDDAGALADGIALILDDPDRAREMGRRGRERARARYQGTAMIEAYEALYRRVAAS